MQNYQKSGILVKPFFKTKNFNKF